MKNTVADLIELLKTLPGDKVILLSSDEEGNSFNTWSGDFGLATDDEWQGWSSFTYDDEDNEVEVTSDDAKAIILWP